MKQLSKNLFSLFSADVIRRLLGFVSVAYLARVLGREDFGAVNLGFAVLAYGMVLGAAGFPTLGTKKIAQGSSSELIGEIMGTRLVTTVFMLMVIMLIVWIGVQNITLVWLIILFLSSLFPQIFFVDWYFQGKETMGVVSASRITQAAIYLFVVLVFVRTASDVLWVAVGAICGECAAAVVQLVQLRKKHKEIHLHLKPSLRLLKESAPLAIGIILGTLVINYPPLVLGILTSASEVGVYSAAGKLVYSLMMGDRILVLLLFPASARKYQESQTAFSHMLNDALRWIVLVCLPIAFGVMLVADDLIHIIFGAEYIVSASVLKVLIWYFFLTMLHTVFTSGLIAAGGEKLYGKIMIVTALTYFVAVSAGTFWFGSIGAAFGVVVAEGLSVLFIRKALLRFLPLPPQDKIIHVLVSVFLMVVIVTVVAQYGFLCMIVAGMMSYGVFIFLFRAVEWSDVRMLIARF